jgi:hypothetical protein
MTLRSVIELLDRSNTVRKADAHGSRAPGPRSQDPKARILAYGPELTVFKEWHALDCGEHSNSATIYDPDSPYDIIELNCTADLDAKPIKSVLPNDTRDERINHPVTNLGDLLHVIEKYPLITNVKYNVNLLALHRIKLPLERLKTMVGMAKLKEAIVDQVLYYVQNLHEIDSNNADFLHTVISGPPGTGKTEVGKIIGEIFTQLGMLKKGKFRKVSRADLIAGYLGQTGIKTKEVIESCMGGVLFIDEAYSLGGDKQDSYSKECVDIICESLSEHKNDLMVIIAGYEEELNNQFFSMNPGLKSRFSWRFATEEYSPDELKQIFVRKVRSADWKLADEESLEKWFASRGGEFRNFGRDTEILFSKAKICHGRRLFGDSEAERGTLNQTDIEKGYEAMISNMQSRRERSPSQDYMYT